jgi:hypothetical protein
VATTLETLAAGRITASELPIATGQGKRADTIRVAPGFGVEKWTASGLLPSCAYTVDALAKFLGEVDERDGKATEAFKATFGALELMDGKNLMVS